MTERTASAASGLDHPREIRLRCHEILSIGERGDLRHFDVRTDRLDDVARTVARVTIWRYPDLKIPPHARWRHFGAGGLDRWNTLASGLDPEERARVALDLLIPSVLLDAGAGDGWRYREAGTGLEFTRSEGLAVASLGLFASGAFSSDPAFPLRADARALRAFDATRLAEAFQVAAGNELEGLEGRAGLLRSLGRAIGERPRLFGDPPRIGGLHDHFRTLPEPPGAAEVLETVIEALGPVWPARIALEGRNLGDVWHHRDIRRPDGTNGLIPFHKLCQWLTYSLIEPLAASGMPMRDISSLTGLAEYRNGGLFIDGGVLEPRDQAARAVAHPPGAELVVEWRALTVALLDRLAPPVRRELAVDDAKLPLAGLLEGGTWAAGRLLAKMAREGGGPPIRLISDGTVF